MKKFCPVCKCTKIKIALQVDDKFKILKCPNCDFAFLSSYPSLDLMKKIYNKNYFTERYNEKYDSDLFTDAEKKYQVANKYLHQKSKILDYGCGTGYFLKICKNHNNQIFGYDISPVIQKTCKQKFDINIKSSPINKDLYKRKQFDLITSFDVIEHIPNYKKVIKFFNLWLKPGGTLIITTPNTQSWDAKFFGKKWYGFTKIPEHVNFFSPKSMKLILEKQGFKKIKIKRWGYVRNLNFVQKKLLPNYTKHLNILNVSLFFPMTNMIIIAKK